MSPILLRGKRVRQGGEKLGRGRMRLTVLATASTVATETPARGMKGRDRTATARVRANACVNFSPILVSSTPTQTNKVGKKDEKIWGGEENSRYADREVPAKQHLRKSNRRQTPSGPHGQNEPGIIPARSSASLAWESNAASHARAAWSGKGSGAFHRAMMASPTYLSTRPW